MSKGKHTPGPWSFKPFGGTDAEIAELQQMGLKPLRMIMNNGAVAVTHADGRICEVDCQSPYKRGAGHLAECEERDANARLIAAAPETAAERDRLKEVNAELLEALKAMLHVFGCGTAIDCSTCDSARAAIAKAEGRT